MIAIRIVCTTQRCNAIRKWNYTRVVTGTGNNTMPQVRQQQSWNSEIRSQSREEAENAKNCKLSVVTGFEGKKQRETAIKPDLIGQMNQRRTSSKVAEIISVAAQWHFQIRISV